MRRLGLMLLAVAVCSGCFRSTTLITVKQDGSGTIDQEIGATAQAMAMMRNFSGGDQKAGADTQIFGPEQAQTAAAAMGVRFISGEPIKTAELQGYRAHFAFDDVTKIKMNPSVNPPGAATAAAETPREPPFTFAFEKKGETSVLTVKMAEQKAGSRGMLPQMPGGGTSDQNAQGLAMILPMLRGLYVDVAVAVEGRVVKTNAPYVNGSQVTLLEFDFDKVNASEGGLQKLQQITDPKMLKDMPGVRMVTDPVMTIEFGR